MNRNFGWDHRDEILGENFLSSAPDSLLADMEALRIHDRFGISSWPQMIVMDPRDDRVIGMPERTVESVTGLFDRAIDEIPDPGSGARRLHRRLRRALRFYDRGDWSEGGRRLIELSRTIDPWLVWLDASRMYRALSINPRLVSSSIDSERSTPDVDDPDPAWRAFSLERYLLVLEDIEQFSQLDVEYGYDDRLIRAVLYDEDIVVRLRALRCLALTEPSMIMEHAAELLQVPNDPLRYEVLSVIERMPNPTLGPDLIRLFAGAGKNIPSMNPNVLRINTVRCLRESGDEGCVEVLLSEVSEPNPRNYLHGLIIETVAEIALRGDDTLRKRTVGDLLLSFPAAMEASEGDEEALARELRISLTFVRKVRSALIRLSGREDLPALPEEWSLRSRSGYLAELHRLFGIE